MTALERALDMLHGARQVGGTWTALCPAHDDHKPSLSIDQRTKGEPGILLVCRSAGCDVRDIVAALGWTMADLYDTPKARSNGHKAGAWTLIDTYPYQDAGGELRYNVKRLLDPAGKKTFRPYKPGAEKPGIDGVARLLFRLPTVTAAVRGGIPIFVVEGEKDVQTLEAAGEVATCNPGGTGQSWRSEYGDVLAGADVTIVADRDASGRKHAAAVAADLKGKARSVRVVRAATGDDNSGDDVTDHLNAGRTLDELVPLADEPATPPATGAISAAVADEADRLRVRHAARELVDAERRQATDMPAFDAGLLAEILARPPEPPQRVDGLLPADGAMLVVAQRKTGKTTFELNLARSLILGEPFLGRFDVRPLAGRVGFLNYEVSAGQIARWADEAGVPADRLYLVNLRGRRNPLQHGEDRQALADRLRAHEVEALMTDPFGRAYTGQNQNDPGEVSAWLADLDRFGRGSAGATDLILSAHAGWNGERSRGASALEDWADSIVTLVRDPDDDDVRFMRAFGRDVDVDEDRLQYDPGSRRLALAGSGSRKASAAVRRRDSLVEAVVAVVRVEPGINGSRLGPALRGRGVSFQKGDERQAAHQAVADGQLRTEPGRRGATLYYLPGIGTNATCPDVPRPSPRDTSLTYPDLPYRGGVCQEDTSGDLPRVTNPGHVAQTALHLVADQLGGAVIDPPPTDQGAPA